MKENGSAVVVKVGGQEIAQGEPIERLARWTAREVRGGARLVIVHGGGEEVTERAEALGLSTEKRQGQRVTSARMLDVVLEVLAGRVNTRLVAALQAAGVPAVGLAGTSGRILGVRPAGSPRGSLGFVGEPTVARVGLLRTLLDQGFTPVVAPVGIDAAGQVYNVNADLAASAIAGALRADLCLVTDVPGVLGASGQLVHKLSATEARRLIGSGVARGGMVPKLEAAAQALRAGSPVWIGNLDGLPTRHHGSGTLVSSPGRSLLRALPRRGTLLGGE
jgi:acetylglutamate kinase